MKKTFFLFCTAISLPMLAENVNYPADTVCLGDGQTLNLKSQFSDPNYSFQWSNGATSNSISVTPTTVGSATYVCEIYSTKPEQRNNLMKNGSFEMPAPTDGFRSDYQYCGNEAGGVDPTQIYDRPSMAGKSGIYVISSDASKAWRDFVSVKAAEGNLFALFDADVSGTPKRAWYANTADNPNLKLEAGKTYRFAFSACNINNKMLEAGKSFNNCAVLQFKIRYRSSGGSYIEHNIGAPLKLNVDNTWKTSSSDWTSPMASDDVEIAVYNQNVSSDFLGNDFALDNVIFQPYNATGKFLVGVETFTVVAKDCSEPNPNPNPQPDGDCRTDMVYAKWNDVLFCNNADNQFVAYQWYCDGVALAGETQQFVYFVNLPDGVVKASSRFRVCATTTDGSVVCSCDSLFADLPRSADTYDKVETAKVIYSRGQLSIFHLQNESYQLKIFTMQGRLLHHFPMAQNCTVLPIDLSRGIYVVELILSDASRQTTKIVVN